MHGDLSTQPPRRSRRRGRARAPRLRGPAGWPDDDHAAAFADLPAQLRGARDGNAALRPADRRCRRSRASAGRPSRGRSPRRRRRRGASSRRISRPSRSFRPPATGFLTGYYEPEFAGLARRERPTLHGAPPRPPGRPRDDPAGRDPAGPRSGPPGRAAARRTGYEPYPDRAAIEDGALGLAARPVVYLREPGEAFIIHVQGSARIRLADGTAMRVAYAGRNGHPYTSIGRLLVERGAMALENEPRAADGLAAGPSRTRPAR